MKYGYEGGYGSVPKKKHRGLIVGLFLFLIVVAIGGFFCYKQFFAKNAIEVLLEGVYDYLEASIDSSDYDSVAGDFSMQVDFLSPDSKENEVLSIFNKLDFVGSYGIDYDKNILSLDLSSNYGDKDLLDFSIYTEYGRGYIYLDGLYDKYIDTSIDNYSEIFERNLDDCKTLVIGSKKAMEASLKEEYFIIEKVSVDGEKMTKTVLDLTGENYQDWNKNFTNSLLNNANYLDSYAKIFDITVEEAVEKLDDSLKEDEDYGGEQYILYTKGREFVKFEMISAEDRIVVVAEDINKYAYELYENDDKFGNGVVQVNWQGNDDSIFVSYYDEEEELGMELTINFTAELNSQLDRKDVSNSISYEKISEDDIMTIYNKLMENEGIIKIIEEISNLIGYDDNNFNSDIITS